MHNYEFRLVDATGRTITPEVGERFRVTDTTVDVRQAPGAPDGATLCTVTMTGTLIGRTAR